MACKRTTPPRKGQRREPRVTKTVRADAWSRHHDQCANCEVDKYPHKSHGYCIRCYPIAQRVRVLEVWTPGQPLPREMAARSILDNEFLAKLCRAWMREYRRRLTQLRRFEQEPSDVSGLDVEHLLREVGWHMRPRVRRNRSPHYGIASWINSQFGAAERRALRKLLIDMLRVLRWTPSYSTIYREAHERENQ
jgi:hypothetical protein